MKGCPLSKQKFEGNCATCAQVNNCVFLDILKMIEDLKQQLRDVERCIQKIDKLEK